MREFRLDGSAWKNENDFYDAFFRVVGAPAWHGRNFNALRDSIVTGSINVIEIPYTIHISGVDRMPADVKKLVDDFCALIQEFRAEGYEVSVTCEA